MTKILMLTHEFPPVRGGIATYASQLAIAAQELNHDVTVLAPDYGQEHSEEDKKNYAFRVVRYHSGQYSFHRFPALLWRSSRFARVESYDMIHAVDAAYVLALSFINKFRNLPFAATVHGTEILSMPSSKQARWLMVPDLFEVPRPIFANSTFTKNLLLERCPAIEEKRIKVTPLGVSPDWFEAPTEPCRTISDLPPEKRKKIILTVSRLDERKGHRSVLKALSRLPTVLQEKVSYVIAGKCDNDTLMRELRNLAGECSAYVHYTDNISTSDLRCLYNAADIYCMPGEPHPSKIEGFGLAYLEAAAARVPSIGSRIGGVPEVVLHEKTGILVEPGDSESLSQALMRLLVDDSYRKRLGEAAYEHAQTFTWRRCAEMTYGA